MYPVPVQSLHVGYWDTTDQRYSGAEMLHDMGSRRVFLCGDVDCLPCTG